MKYEIGDIVEVRCSRDAPWFEGVIKEIDDDSYLVKLVTEQLLSTLHKRKFKRDLKTSVVSVKKHIETIGLGYLHLRLKNPKDFKPR